MNSEKLEQPSPLHLRGDSPLTAPHRSTLRPLQASEASASKTAARRWAEEQLLQARAKTEAQRRCFWLETQTQRKRKAREAAEYSVRLRRVILVGFIPPSQSSDAILTANDTNDAANSSKTASATSSPCGPLRAASSSPTSPTSSGSSGTRAKLRSSSRPPMTWGTLKDQVKTPSLRQTEPLHLGKRKRRQAGDGEVEAGLGEGSRDRGGRVARRYAA